VRQDVTFKSSGLNIAGHIYIPDSRNDRVPAVVVAHPMGGVKEQTAGSYAEQLSREGFVALAFDAAYQGESGGEPHGLEDPFQRSEDVRSAVTFLANRPEVDPNAIGALGICASGGYVPFAAQTDHRIKAVATVSGACVGMLWRGGMDGGQSEDVIREMLSQAGVDRNAEGSGEQPRVENIIPGTEEEALKLLPDSTFREEYYYYRTPRAQHPRAPMTWVPRSVDRIAQYESYALIHLISPRPLLMIAGTKADTARFSALAIEKAKGPKELFWIEGAHHVDLYDSDLYVPQALAKLRAFFKEHLMPARARTAA
jgi:fermentation-respiration switch protein FrsA (DUF1100 family)